MLFVFVGARVAFVLFVFLGNRRFCVICILDSVYFVLFVLVGAW